MTRAAVPRVVPHTCALRPPHQATVLSDVPLATEVEVEPQGPSDWEVVEANAGFLEEHLLGQVG